MTVKMKARELGFDDMRYDVEVVELRTAGNPQQRVVGQLQGITGPYGVNEKGLVVDRIMLRIGPAYMPLDTVVDADSEVTVDRDPERKSIHHFASESKVLPC